jgi:competence protein ComFC
MPPEVVCDCLRAGLRPRCRADFVAPTVYRAGMRLATSLLGALKCSGCGSRGGPVCSSCLAHLGPPANRQGLPGIDRVVAAWEHRGAARNLVLDLKLGGARWAAEPLAAAMFAAAARTGLRGDVVTWVPGRRREAAQRGYDHAELLAVRVGRRLGLRPVGMLRRVRPVGDQASLSARERFANLAGAFASRPCSGAVVLVDDVVTTGATAAACAAALRAAGATWVEVLAACRRS